MVAALAGEMKSKLLEIRSKAVSECLRINFTYRLYFNIRFRPIASVRITLKSADPQAHLPMSVGVNRFSGPRSIGRSGERKLEVLSGIEGGVKKGSLR